ncbi:hypothetical protein TNCV_5135321 [Trichonephila clavipes]|nr:hypothetical protein TNCV_5135321 [Trichonephila clavipes]
MYWIILGGGLWATIYSRRTFIWREPGILFLPSNVREIDHYNREWRLDRLRAIDPDFILMDDNAWLAHLVIEFLESEDIAEWIGVLDLHTHWNTLRRSISSRKPHPRTIQPLENKVAEHTHSHDDIDELLVDDALSDNDVIDLTLDLTVDSVVGLEGDNDEEEKLTPLTGKLIQEGLQL